MTPASLQGMCSHQDRASPVATETFTAGLVSPAALHFIRTTPPALSAIPDHLSWMGRGKENRRLDRFSLFFRHQIKTNTGVLLCSAHRVVSILTTETCWHGMRAASDGGRWTAVSPCPHVNKTLLETTTTTRRKEARLKPSHLQMPSSCKSSLGTDIAEVPDMAKRSLSDHLPPSAPASQHPVFLPSCQLERQAEWSEQVNSVLDYESNSVEGMEGGCYLDLEGRGGKDTCLLPRQSRGRLP